MALSRRFLKGLLVEYGNCDEMIDQIVEAHYETIAGLKAELQQMRDANGGKTYDEIHAEYERLAAELDHLKAGEVDENGTPWKTRYEEEKARYGAFKAAEEEAEAYREKQRIYREILASCNVPYRIRELILDADRTTIDGLDVSFGKVRNLEEIKANIIRDYGEFIPKATRSQHPVLFER